MDRNEKKIAGVNESITCRRINSTELQLQTKISENAPNQKRKPTNCKTNALRKPKPSK